MLDIDDEIGILPHINIDLLHKIIYKILGEKKNIYVELIFIDDNAMRAMNKEYMNKDYATDVLSFPLQIMDIESIQCLGSIIINGDEVERNVENLGHDIASEVAILFIHAMLHLMGFDHEIDSGEHRKAETEIINFFHLNSGLIDRNH